MFSGIVEERGRIASRKELPQGGLTIGVVCSSEFSKASLGDSVAVNGACLTVSRYEVGKLYFDVVPETLRKTNLGNLDPEHTVNLERSVKLGDRLHGHLVTGHIDATAVVERRSADGVSTNLVISLPSELRRFVAPKGSIAVSGVSLTVGEVSEENFSVYIVPHTAAVTSLGELRPGDRVNLEVDLVARYVCQAVLGAGHVE